MRSALVTIYNIYYLVPTHLKFLTALQFVFNAGFLPKFNMNLFLILLVFALSGGNVILATHHSYTDYTCAAGGYCAPPPCESGQDPIEDGPCSCTPELHDTGCVIANCTDGDVIPSTGNYVCICNPDCPNSSPRYCVSVQCRDTSYYGYDNNDYGYGDYDYGYYGCYDDYFECDNTPLYNCYVPTEYGYCINNLPCYCTNGYWPDGCTIPYCTGNPSTDAYPCLCTEANPDQSGCLRDQT